MLHSWIYGLILYWCFFPILWADTTEQNKKYFFDTYRTEQVTAAEIQSLYGKGLASFVQLNDIKHNPIDTGMSESEMKTHLQAIEEMKKSIQSRWHFDEVNLSTIIFPGIDKPYITLEVIDPKDHRHRLKFYDAPQKKLPDPGGLLATWTEYFNKALPLFLSNQLPAFKSCPASHCVFGFEHPDLKKYAEIFNKNVPPHQSELFQIIQEGSDPIKRADAIFLLAHIPDPSTIIPVLLHAIHDPEKNVRNNAMRVLGHIFSSGYPVPENFPIEEILKAIDAPDTTDRNKALSVLSVLSEQKRFQPIIQAHGLMILLKNWENQYPGTHEYAGTILKNITHHQHDHWSLAQWKKWVQKESQGVMTP